MNRDNRGSLEKIRRRLEEEMSRHEGVSCDACMKSNFKGRRFKCLRCYDYDLCASCYEAGATTSRHSPDHPLQCILSRTDYELYYGGETSTEINHALTCPVCGRLGFTESELQTHVSAEHVSCNTEVVCPICASVPGGEPNLVTDDLAAHLTLEHRPQARDDGQSARQNLRRVQQPSRTLGVGRGRRPNMHFSSGGLSPSGTRDPVDPIAELLSQLSGVRRAAVPYDRLLHPRHGAGAVGSAPHQAGSAVAAAAAAPGSSSGAAPPSAIGSTRRSVFPPPPNSQAVVFTAADAAGTSQLAAMSTSQDSSNSRNDKHQFLLDKYLDSQRRRELTPDQSLFLQDLVLSTMTLQARDTKEDDDPDPDLQSAPPQ